MCANEKIVDILWAAIFSSNTYTKRLNAGEQVFVGGKNENRRYFFPCTVDIFQYFWGHAAALSKCALIFFLNIIRSSRKRLNFFEKKLRETKHSLRKKGGGGNL